MKTKPALVLVIMGLICLLLPAACGQAEKTAKTLQNPDILATPSPARS